MVGAVSVAVLGPVVLTVNGAPVSLRPREAAVLAALALQPGTDVSAERLADAVWGPSDEVLRPAVQVQVSRLRRALGPAADLLVTVPGGYRFDIEPMSVDAGVFAAEVARARAALSGGRHHETLTAATKGLTLWRGPALGGSAEGWAAAEAGRLEESRLLAEEDRAEALTAFDPARAAIDLEPLADNEPLHERRWWLLASALAGCGRQGDALRALDRARDILREELGVSPGPELVALERQLLDQDPAVLGSERPMRRRGWLPTPISSFVGRGHELDDLTNLCASARLITLTGTGGIGKTRLSLELAQRLVPTRRGGAWWIELDRLNDPDEVLGAVAASVAAEYEGAEPLTRAKSALGREPSLIVLDSCEHVLEGAAATAAALLSDCPDLLVMATSREPLGVPGEVAWVVPPLTLEPASDTALSDAVALLYDRGASANPRLDMARWTIELETVARAVDGLPLALELAAARLRAIDPGQLADALSQQLGVLVGRARGGPARHATMSAALDWGVALCTPIELAVLSRCSVFRGGFTHDAAVVVASACGPPVTESEVAPALESLATHSLLTSADGRIRVLEPVRQWAEARLTSTGLAERATAAHGAWAVALADTIGRRASRDPEPGDSTTLAAEHANFLTAVSRSLADRSDQGLRIVGALGHSWAAAGWREALTYATDALQNDPGVEPRVRARALVAAAELAGVVPDPATAVSLLREAVALARGGAGSRQLHWALFDLGKALMLSTPTEGGGPDEAQACFSEALAGFEESADPFGQSWALANLGYLALSEADDAAAGDLYSRAHSLAAAGPFPHVLAVIHRERAVLASRCGDHVTALAEASAAIDSYRHQGDLWQLVNALSIGAEVSWDAGERGQALARADEAFVTSTLSGFGDNIGLTAAWVAHRALNVNLDTQARHLGELIIEPLERRSRLWPVTAAAIAALRARFPDLQGREASAAPSEIAHEGRSALAAIADLLNAEEGDDLAGSPTE
jgi:predicted ATPase/DNA-binding SARP family transcriptional activator